MRVLALDANHELHRRIRVAFVNLVRPTSSRRPALRRRAERDPQNPELVLTVRGVGYEFDGSGA